MGRPRKYFTAEAKAAANRNKSARSYQKHSQKINKRRRRQYQKSHQPSPPEIIQPKPGPPTGNAPKPEPEPHYWLERARQIPDRIDHVIGKDRMQYFERACQVFLDAPGNETEKANVHRTLTTVNSISERLTHYHNKILNLFGVGDEWKEVQTIALSTRETIQVLEEITVLGTVAHEDLIQSYADGDLLYQKLHK
ncbi:hypothetical protein DFP72DRAFT_1080247 [Ephemerocybe angulata]|uniref:Uncharacterized protein n=1 Tax=Ephemerocybe angulata TaxID=980116 RepID=A0A8H6HBR5_9AGAR|nr:hypothetical protein DFP72DRAFT_1080247 [Tulosesus angulatus]